MLTCVVGANTEPNWELSLEQCDNDEVRPLNQQDLLDKLQEEIELVLGWSNCAISVLTFTDDTHQQQAQLKEG